MSVIIISINTNRLVLISSQRPRLNIKKTAHVQKKGKGKPPEKIGLLNKIGPIGEGKKIPADRRSVDTNK